MSVRRMRAGPCTPWPSRPRTSPELESQPAERGARRAIGFVEEDHGHKGNVAVHGGGGLASATMARPRLSDHAQSAMRAIGLPPPTCETGFTPPYLTYADSARELWTPTCSSLPICAGRPRQSSQQRVHFEWLGAGTRGGTAQPRTRDAPASQRYSDELPSQSSPRRACPCPPTLSA